MIRGQWSKPVKIRMVHVRLKNYHVIKANADGSFDLPENIDKKNIYYYVEDFAGNVDYVSLADLVRDQNSGRIQIAVRDAKTNKDIDTMYAYRSRTAMVNM